jgi:hypothetical protein
VHATRDGQQRRNIVQHYGDTLKIPIQLNNNVKTNEYTDWFDLSDLNLKFGVAQKK